MDIHNAVNIHNEWDPLEEIVIGTAINAKFPSRDFAFKVNVAADLGVLPTMDVKIVEIPDYIIEETEEDLSLFAQALKNLGVNVRRPDPIDTSLTIQTPYWNTSMYFNYCPRDILLAIGNTIIETPNVNQSRYFESFSYRSILLDYFNKGCKWLAAPKPLLTKNQFNVHPEAQTTLNNHEPMFDAANILRAGKDIFFLISNSGNWKGFYWLERILGEEYNIHPCENLYSGVHFDTTLAFLKPGLILANPERVNKDNLPKLLQQWEVIYAPPMSEYRYSDLPPLSSKWIGMNLLMVNPQLAIVDAHQIELIKLLNKKGIDALPLRLRHGRVLGGGFHCTTLDIRRNGTKESYWGG